MAAGSADGSNLALLESILSLLQDLLIIELAREGVSKEETRKIVGVGSAKVSRIWQHLSQERG